jgi:hypothetical protein
MREATYSIADGLLEVWDHVDYSPNERCVYETVGYSGRGLHKNDPASCCVRGLGPLPCGSYRVGYEEHHPGLGPDVLPLDPEPQNDMCGRSGFYIHGDSAEHPGQASSGCIILPRSSRQALAAYQVTRLIVVPGPQGRGLEQWT